MIRDPPPGRMAAMSDQNIKTVQGIYEAFGRGRCRAHPRAGHRRRGLGLGGPWRGRPVARDPQGSAEVPQFFQELAAHIEVTEFMPLSFASNEDGDVMTVVRFGMTIPATGKSGDDGSPPLVPVPGRQGGVLPRHRGHRPRPRSSSATEDLARRPARPSARRRRWRRARSSPSRCRPSARGRTARAASGPCRVSIPGGRWAKEHPRLHSSVHHAVSTTSTGVGRARARAGPPSRRAPRARRSAGVHRVQPLGHRPERERCDDARAARGG